jgi:hypothetical protein
MLEEGSFRGRTADFVMMFIFGGVCMIVSLPCSKTKFWVFRHYYPIVKKLRNTVIIYFSLSVTIPVLKSELCELFYLQKNYIKTFCCYAFVKAPQSEKELGYNLVAVMYEWISLKLDSPNTLVTIFVVHFHPKDFTQEY